MRHPAPLADIRETRRDRDVGRGQRLAAEHQRLFDQAIADALRADGPMVRVDQASAAQPDRHQVGHAEQGAHSADMHHRVGLAGKARLQMAEIGGGAADIGDDRVVEF